MKKRTQILSIILISAALVMSGCSLESQTAQGSQSTTVASEDSTSPSAGITNTTASADTAKDTTATSTLSISAEDMFSDRDLEQTADTSDATYLTVESGKELSITQEGVYVISGEATDCTIKIDADSAKVQLVLDGVKVTNTDSPAIYVVNADKVFVTTTHQKRVIKAHAFSCLFNQFWRCLKPQHSHCRVTWKHIKSEEYA